MIKKSKFMLIYEEVMEQLIEVNGSPITFKFGVNDMGEITSSFSDIDNEGNVTVIKAVDNGKNITFNVQEQEEDKKAMDEKQFMMNYQKTYENFKKAIEKYKKEIGHNKNEEVTAQIVDKSNKPVPEIKSFNEILKQSDANPNNDGTEIKTKSTVFTFKKANDEKYKDLAFANFILINSNPDSDNESTKYDATAVIKLAGKNSVIAKIQLNDPTNNETIETITASDLKSKYPDVFNDLRNATSMFEKEANQNNLNVK